MHSIRDQSNKAKKASKRRNTRKKSLSPTNFKTSETSEIYTADASDVPSKKYECKRSLSEGSGKAKHRKNNVRRTLSHPYSEKLQAECKPSKVQSDSESATCDNSLVPDVFSDNYVECINSDVKYDKKAANVKPEEVKPRIDAVVVEHSVSIKGRVFDKFTAVQATDEGVSDESHQPLETTSSDRDTEDERKPYSRYSNPFRKEYEALNEEFRAGVKSINDQWKVLENLRNNMHELRKSTQEQSIEPLIKFGRQPFAQDSGSDLESLAASTLRRVSVRRRRGTPETGSSSAKEDNYEAAEGDRMRPEDYRLVFISSDSSSRESEAGESSAGEDGSWDYFEAGGGAVAGGGCGRACSCGAAPRVLPVPVPVPVPVPAALWPDAAAAWPFAPYAFQRFHAADMSRRLPNSGFLAASFTQNEAAYTEIPPATSAAQSDDNNTSLELDNKTTFETVGSKKSNIISMTPPSENVGKPTVDEGDAIIPESLIESATDMQKLSVLPESKESTKYALPPAAVASNEPLGGYLYSDKAFCSTSDSGESTSEDEGAARGSYDVAGVASASSDEERPPRYSDVYVVNPADSSSDVEDNADSSGLECSDGEPPLTVDEQLNNQINAEIADRSQYDPDDAYFEKLKEKEKLDEALPAELKDADDLIIPYGDQYIGIYDESKQFKKCTDFKRFCDANMLHAEPKPVDADKIVFACSDITNFAVNFEPEARRAEEKLLDRVSPDPKEEKENEIAGGETKVKAEGVIANRFLDEFEQPGEKESETPRDPTIGGTDDFTDASKFSSDYSSEGEGRESPTSRGSRTNAELLRGIERTISELLIKENSLALGNGDCAEKLSPATSDEEGERAARGAGRGRRRGSSGEAADAPVESPRSARADCCARYTSRVMITQEPSPSQVSVITSDTTRLMADVTVQHTNSQNENDKYRRFARDDEFEEREADAEGHGGVRVVTNADTLSAVVCLEEGLADDDSWVEEADSTPSESDSGDDAAFEREEDFSAYRRQALDFTLHTIVEESCEESEPERAERKARPVSATELEKYFFFGLGDGRHTSEAGEDAHSETSSACSEGGDSPAGDELAEPDERHDVERLASSRLEKYFLSGFMGFDRERRDSDGSGSVGSDSEGRHSPEQRKKRLVRARGTGRSHSSSLDNLLSGSEMQLEQQIEAASDSEGSSTETGTYNDTSIDSQGDGSKRKKQSKKVRSSPGDEKKHSMEPRDEPATRDDARSISEGEEDGSVTPQPEFLPLGSDLSNSKKQTSRDSGFVGSCDDLLKNDVGADGHISKPTDLKLDLEEIVEENKLDSDDKSDLLRLRQYPQTTLMRKDSFNNWSSDEETNLMMNRMRQFFKSMVAAAQPPAEEPAPGSKPTTPSTNRTSLGPRPRRTAKPPQLVYFESELTRLMKTVPGIRDEEVKEIVEYLSSEDTWSDSYDSSDYTSSDVEGVGGGKAALQRQISESCKEIIDKFDRVEEAPGDESPGAADHPPNFGRDTAYVYQKLVASLSKISTDAEGREPSADSPHGSPLVTKVIRHIGSRLVALMHEVSSGESGASVSPRARAPRRPRPASASTTEDDDSASDAGARAALPRSKSHDVLAHETQRGRGAEERDEREASDCDRLSWRGSFESALLAADSRGALAVEAAGQRRSAGDLLAAQRSQSRSCGAIGGSEDRLWRGRRRSSAPDTAPEDEEERPRATGSLPRLPSGAAPVKSARYRPPGFTRAQRAVSAPGLHALRAPRRRPPPPTPTVSSPASAPSLQDEIYTAEILTATPRATLPRRSNSPVPHHEHEDELDRLVGLHQNRSGLHGRSESMASVYSGAGDGARGSVTVRGATQFSLLYNYRQGALEVGVRRCRDLAPVDVKRNRSDPYVKVYLLPDKSKCGKRKTKVKKNTLNPIFDETLRFIQPLSALSGRTLWLSVWHADMFGRNDFLGEVTLPLGDIVFDDPTPKWYNLQERTEQFEEHQGNKGDLIVGLKFELPDQNASPNNRTKGTLHVLVKEAKNLCASKPNGLADAFCKSYLLPERGRGAKQKTTVARRTLSPRWETCFTYRALSLSDLQQRALELSVWDRDLLSSNDFMGGVRFSLGTGTYLGANVDWMDSVGKEVTLWQTMMQRPNFWVEGSVPLRPSLSN